MIKYSSFENTIKVFQLIYIIHLSTRTTSFACPVRFFIDSITLSASQFSTTNRSGRATNCVVSDSERLKDDGLDWSLSLESSRCDDGPAALAWKIRDKRHTSDEESSMQRRVTILLSKRRPQCLAHHTSGADRLLRPLEYGTSPAMKGSSE